MGFVSSLAGDPPPTVTSAGVWTTYTAGDDVQALAMEGHYIWAGTTVGVVRWDTSVGTYARFDTRNSGLAGNSMRAVVVDGTGAKWFGTMGGGVSRFDGTTWTTYNTANSSLAGNTVTTIAVDAAGARWFGTSYGGVSRLDGAIWTTYNTSNSGLASDYVYAIAVDGTGARWFGTDGGGVSRFDGTTWSTYNTSNSGLAIDKVRAIAVDASGAKWFGTLGSGVSRFVEAGAQTPIPTATATGAPTSTLTATPTGAPTASPAPPTGGTWTGYTNGDDVQSLALEGGYLWAGTTGGVVRRDIATGSYAILDRWNSGLPNNNVYAIAVDGAGTKWFGTDGGVSRFDGATWINYTASNSGLAHNHVYAVAVEAGGARWFGTNGGGVSRFDGATWTTYNSSNSGLARNTVRAIAVDGDGIGWFGTDGGVSRFDGTSWTTYTTSNSGLAAGIVRAIAEDSAGAMWFATNSGVSRFDGTTWTTYSTSNSGLADNNVHAIAVDASGAKWFGGGGVSRFVETGAQTATPTRTGTATATPSPSATPTRTPVPAEQRINLHAGWNWISFAVLPTPVGGGTTPTALPVETVLASITGTYDFVLGETGAYAASPPYPGANTLTGLEAGRGYFVRMTREATLHLVGLRLPVESSLPLSAGWRWIGYLPETPRDLPGALDSVAGRYDYLLGEHGTYSPLPPYAGANSLSGMEPGRGYLIRMRQEGTLVYGPGG